MEFVIDSRRKAVIPGSKEATLTYAIDQWIKIALESIATHGSFYVALSGGSTPKLIYQGLVTRKKEIPWDKVFLFWSDERSVPPSDPESNYHMAMSQGGLDTLGIPSSQIFRMEAESAIENNALAYEKLLHTRVPRPFDLIMIGMGEDGHTASLFPHTEALHVVNRLVVANFVPQKKTYRMTFTFECLNRASHLILYALGEGKAEILAQVLTSSFNPDELPSQRVGTLEHPALFIIDEDAAKNLKSLRKI